MDNQRARITITTPEGETPADYVADDAGNRRNLHRIADKLAAHIKRDVTT